MEIFEDPAFKRDKAMIEDVKVGKEMAKVLL